MTHKQEPPATMLSGSRRRNSLSDLQTYPFEMGYLPPYFQKKSEIELSDTPENIENGLKEMREMIKRDKNFTDQKFDDDVLMFFLRPRKFNVQRAFSNLKSFVSLRRKNIDAFTSIQFESIAIATRNNILTFLPRRCQDGCAVLHIELENWEPKDFPIEEVKRAVVVLIAQASRDPMTQVNGFKVIFNVKSNPLKHIRYCTPSNLYLMYHGTQECGPGRYKEVHVVNKSLTLTAAWFVIKPFLSNKIRQRIIFHSEAESLLDYFPRSVLPVEYGGDLEDLDMTEWLRKATQPDKLAVISGYN